MFGRTATRRSGPACAWQARSAERGRCSPRSTAAASRRDRPARRPADAAMCCPPAATSSPPIRAPCRRRPPLRSRHALRPTRSCAATCKTHGDMPRALVIDLWGSATLAHRRRGDRAGAGADGLPAALGSGHRPRDRGRGAALRGSSAVRASTSPGAFPGCSAICFRRRSRCSTPQRAGGRGARRGRRRQSARGRGRACGASRPRAHLRLLARQPTARDRGLWSAATADRGRARPGLSRCRLARLWRRRWRRAAQLPAPSPIASHGADFSSMAATIPAAICSKARTTSPSSAASRQPSRRSAARPI